MDKFSKLQREAIDKNGYEWIKELSLGSFEEYEKAMRHMGESFTPSRIPAANHLRQFAVCTFFRFRNTME